MKIGIIGNGFVGSATALLECIDISIIMYDINPNLCNPPNTTLNDICNCDLIFISVPTPMNKNGSCHTNILESVVHNISQIKSTKELLLVNRCTVPVNTSNDLNCYYMPEFLTEKNFKNDFINNPEWIFGLKNSATDILFKEKITELINVAYKNKCINSNKIHFVDNNEAEMIKLFRNTFLSTKISFCNEIYQFCQSQNISYENVRKLATNDPRIGSSHTNVPGHDGFFGYGGTCFPKDTNSLYFQMKEKNLNSYIIKATVERNEIVDRSQHDWKSNVNRAVIREEE
jgi:UDPglucose 6-dehydrogenase